MQEVESYRALQQRRVGFKFHHFSYGYEPIREFFRQYALSQEIPDLKEHEVEEFISPDTADERKLYLGQLFLSKAVKLVADDIYPTYKEIKQAGKLHPLRPNGPRTLIRNVLGNLDQRSVLAEQLATSLKDRYAIAA
jgi:hypothetical protein